MERPYHTHTVQMSKSLKALFSDYEPVPEFLTDDSIEGFISGYLEIYCWFLRGLPLTRIIYKLNLRGDLEESRELAKELQTPQDFIEEAEDMLGYLFDCRVIQTTDLSRLAELENVSIKICEERGK